MTEHHDISAEDERGSHTPHDRLFKELLTVFVYEFLELFLPDLAEMVDRDSLVPLDKELFTALGTGTRREADLVYRARMQGHDVFFLIHLEHEAQDKTGFPRRMFRYFFILHDNYDLPIYPVALLSYQTSRRRAASSYRVAFPGFEPLRFRYRTIQLNRLSWRDYVRRPNPVAAALMSRMHIAPEERPKVKFSCLRLLRRLDLEKVKSMLVSGFIDHYLPLDPQEEERFRDELRSIAPEEQEAIMELTTSWEQKGIHKALLVALETRFGDVPDDLRARLDAVAEPDVLVELVRQAITAASLDEFVNRLPAD